MTEFEKLVLEKLSAIDTNFSKIDNRFIALEDRLKKLEEFQPIVLERFSAIDARLANIEDTVNVIEHKVSVLEVKLDRISRWTQYDLAEKDPLLKSRGIA